MYALRPYQERAVGELNECSEKQLFKKINTSQTNAIIHRDSGDVFYINSAAKIFKRNAAGKCFVMVASDYLSDFDFEWYPCRKQFIKENGAHELNVKAFLDFVVEQGGILPCSN